MDGQLSFATLDYAGKKKRTKRDVFLAEMAAAVPWSVLRKQMAVGYTIQNFGSNGVSLVRFYLLTRSTIGVEIAFEFRVYEQAQATTELRKGRPNVPHTDHQRLRRHRRCRAQRLSRRICRDRWRATSPPSARRRRSPRRGTSTR